MRRRRGRRSSGLDSFDGINITPFTDVLLVLLIIFMIAGSSLAPTGVAMDGRAQEESGSEPADESAKMTVTIAQDGVVAIRFGDQQLRWEELKSLQPIPQAILVIDPDATADQIVGVYDRLIGEGLTDIQWAAPRQAPSGEI